LTLFVTQHGGARLHIDAVGTRRIARLRLDLRYVEENVKSLKNNGENLGSASEGLYLR